jgi:hypothetical protein
MQNPKSQIPNPCLRQAGQTSSKFQFPNDQNNFTWNFGDWNLLGI